MAQINLAELFEMERCQCFHCLLSESIVAQLQSLKAVQLTVNQYSNTLIADIAPLCLKILQIFVFIAYAFYDPQIQVKLLLAIAGSSETRDIVKGFHIGFNQLA